MKHAWAQEGTVGNDATEGEEVEGDILVGLFYCRGHCPVWR